MKDEKNKQQQPQQPQQSDTGQKKNTGPDSSGQRPTEKDPSKTSHDNSRKAGMQQPMDVGEGDIENPDQKEQPGKKINIDDDPDQTKKKVPNMHK